MSRRWRAGPGPDGGRASALGRALARVVVACLALASTLVGLSNLADAASLPARAPAARAVDADLNELDSAGLPAGCSRSAEAIEVHSSMRGYDQVAHPARMSARGVGYRFAPQTGADDCGLPVFMPGGDTPETTAHVVDALASNPAWSVLTRAGHPDSTTNRTWYRGDPRCAGEVGDALSCDEYPFYASRQGGPGASLRLVPGWEQNRQGGYLRNFYAACGIGQGDDYVVAPVPLQPTTTFRC